VADLTEEIPDIELRDKAVPGDEPDTKPFHRLNS
jgi:hypothetical protein